MQSVTLTPESYIAGMPEERKEAFSKLRAAIKKGLPEGFKEGMAYGMIGYYVPHAVYPAGYHCDPKQPLPFMSIASQKNFIAVYHMGLYAIPELMNWFTGEYARQVPAKLDMGKSCIRFKNPAQVPVKLIGELASKLTPEEWIAVYEKNIKR